LPLRIGAAGHTRLPGLLAPAGVDIIFLSPGRRISSTDKWSLFLALGKSVYDDFNGRQTDVNFRLVGGFCFTF